jgi:hypothetical protein
MISPPYMRGQMELYGEVADLEALHSVAAACGCTVEPGPDQKLWLGGDTFDRATTPEQALDEATKVLALLNGLARLENHNHRNVDAGDAFVQNGQLHRYKPRQSRPPLGTQLYVSASPLTGGLVAPVADPVSERRRSRIVADPNLRAIADVFSTEMSWQRLRNAFEKIRALVGKGTDNALVKHGYATAVELANFKASVEDPRNYGAEAVHGVPKGPPKGSPMTKVQAHAFVVRLLHTYVDRNP